MFRFFRFNIISIVLILIVAAPFSNSQVQPKNYKILGISVEGNKSADAATIIMSSGLKVNDEIQVPGTQTIEAINNLWSLNIFSDIQILIEKEVSGGVFLIIKVEEYPRIERVVVEGEDELSEDDVLEMSPFIRGQTLKPYAVQQMKLRILEAYEEEGYINAEVEPVYMEFYKADSSEDEITVTWRNSDDYTEEYVTEYETDDPRNKNLIEKIKDRVLLKLDIEENDEVVVREIYFVGNDAIEDDDLEGAMEEIEEALWWKFWSSANFDREKFEEDKMLVRQYYQSQGYRDADILGDSIVYKNNKADMEIYINVYEGPQYFIRNIDWQGNTIYSDQFLTSRLGFRKGDVYDYQKFQQNLRGNETQTDIAALYLDNGYLTFDVKPLEERVPGDSMDVKIQVSENNQFTIGEVSINGNTRTMEKVIRRELYTLPGDYFNRAAMLRSLQQLANLQYFNVEKLYQKGYDLRLAGDSVVNIAYNVEEKSSDYLNASIGYSGAFGFSGAVGITLTNFSIAHPFQMGGGQVLSFNWQFGVGNLYRTFTLGFTEPWLYDTPTSVGFEFFDTRQRYYYDMSQTGITFRVGRRLKWPDDYFFVQGMARYQHNDVLEGGAYYAEGLSDQYTIGGTVSRKNIDNPIFPSQGSSVVFNGELSGGPLLPGNVDYFKVKFKADWYRRLLNSNKFTLFTGMELGYLKELVAGTPVPPLDRFFMGGSGLVIATIPLRGYEDRSIGPQGVAGGNVYAKYTTELRFAVALEPIPLYILTFAEAGNIYRDLSTTDMFTLRKSVGFGARILINPIGLLGFDIGYGFDRQEVDGQDPEWKFHFQFGQAF